MLKDDSFEDLLRSRFENFEATPPAGAWANISGRIARQPLRLLWLPLLSGITGMAVLLLAVVYGPEMVGGEGLLGGAAVSHAGQATQANGKSAALQAIDGSTLKAKNGEEVSAEAAISSQQAMVLNADKTERRAINIQADQAFTNGEVANNQAYNANGLTADNALGNVGRMAENDGTESATMGKGGRASLAFAPMAKKKKKKNSLASFGATSRSARNNGLSLPAPDSYLGWDAPGVDAKPNSDAANNQSAPAARIANANAIEGDISDLDLAAGQGVPGLSLALPKNGVPDLMALLLADSVRPARAPQREPLKPREPWCLEAYLMPRYGLQRFRSQPNAQMQVLEQNDDAGSASQRVGLELGLRAAKALTNNIEWQGGLSYTRLGVQLDYRVQTDQVIGTIASPEGPKLQYYQANRQTIGDFTYLGLSSGMAYYLTPSHRVRLNGGLSGHLLLQGRTITLENGQELSTVYYPSTQSPQQQFNWAGYLGLGLQAPIDERASVWLEPTYTYYFSNLYKPSMPFSLKQNTLGLNIIFRYQF
jgi:hypothetical protein